MNLRVKLLGDCKSRHDLGESLGLRWRCESFELIERGEFTIIRAENNFKEQAEPWLVT